MHGHLWEGRKDNDRGGDAVSSDGVRDGGDQGNDGGGGPGGSGDDEDVNDDGPVSNEGTREERMDDGEVSNEDGNDDGRAASESDDDGDQATKEVDSPAHDRDGVRDSIHVHDGVLGSNRDACDGHDLESCDDVHGDDVCQVYRDGGYRANDCAMSGDRDRVNDCVMSDDHDHVNNFVIFDDEGDHAGGTGCI